jgi:diguanylate cyclase (GGDEF)-like protein
VSDDDRGGRVASTADSGRKGVETTVTRLSLPGRHAKPERALWLTSHDVALGWILAAMAAFGALVGLVFPWLVASMVVVRDDQELAFRLACVIAGLSVGGFAYGIAKFTLHRANRHLTALAAYDTLTGLANRRQFVRALDAELGRADRSGESTSLVIADLDYFKAINDECGHLVGDDVLVAVAAVLKTAVRPSDLVCRIGGEEFALVLPSTDARTASLVAERVRAAVADMAHDGVRRVTLSCGVATYPADANSPSLLTKRADDAMYAAKRAGRNTVLTWEVATARGAGGVSEGAADSAP